MQLNCDCQSKDASLDMSNRRKKIIAINIITLLSGLIIKPLPLSSAVISAMSSSSTGSHSGCDNGLIKMDIIVDILNSTTAMTLQGRVMQLLILLCLISKCKMHAIQSGRPLT